MKALLKFSLEKLLGKISGRNLILQEKSGLRKEVFLSFQNLAES
jgi:hypothetical protein